MAKAQYFDIFKKFPGINSVLSTIDQVSSGVAVQFTNFINMDLGIHKWDSICYEAFESLKESITTALFQIAPDRKKHFRGHVYAFQLAVGGTLTLLD